MGTFVLPVIGKCADADARLLASRSSVSRLTTRSAISRIFGRWGVMTTVSDLLSRSTSAADTCGFTGASSKLVWYSARIIQAGTARPTKVTMTVPIITSRTSARRSESRSADVSFFSSCGLTMVADAGASPSSRARTAGLRDDVMINSELKGSVLRVSGSSADRPLTMSAGEKSGPARPATLARPAMTASRTRGRAAHLHRYIR
jgi:hypothetical protein